MKKARSLAGMFALLVGAAAILGSPQTVDAGETSMHFKTGWFTWDETINGSDFVKEKGMMYGVGVTRKDAVSKVFIAEGLEVWGGNIDYDGHDLSGTKDLHTDTSYLGTREEVTVSMKIPATSLGLSVEPLLGLGHKFWVRTRSSEDWNTFYGRGGVAGEMNVEGVSIFLKGGAIVPIYTRNHVSLAGAGLADVVTEPKSRVSAFAEGGVRFGSLSVSVEYEGMEFGESGRVKTHALSPVSTGAIVVGTEAYQPKSSSTFVGLRIGYTF